MADKKYKKDVPEDRTIVPGVWSDLLDDASVTFDIDKSTGAVRVNIKNLEEFGLLLEQILARLVDQNSVIIKQLCLLNVRFEEIAQTRINDKDVGERDVN